MEILKGLICCYQSLGEKKYLELGLKNADFLIKNFLNKKNLKRIFQSEINAFIDDYAHTISAFIKLYEVSKKNTYLDLARNLTEESIKLFYNEDEKLFNFNGRQKQSY